MQQAVDLDRADRGFYMDFYPWLSKDGTLFLTVAVFSQFYCHAPVFQEKIIGPWKDHQKHQNIIYGLFYLCGFTVLYTWNISSYHAFNLNMYIFLFGGLLLAWSFLKVKFKRNSEVFLTSSFELLLIFISWFIPYVILPAIDVPEPVLNAAKLACLGAIPLLIAMKLVIKRQPHRNRNMAIAQISILCLIAVRDL